MRSSPALRRIALAAVLVAACGGMHPADLEEGPAPGPEDRARAQRIGEVARLALVDGDLGEARARADQALVVDPSEPTAMEVAARVALAEGRYGDAVQVLNPARRPRLVRLRARAHVRRGELGRAAAALDSVADREPVDGWADALLPIARAAAGRQAYGLEGPGRAALPMRDGVPVPVVDISVDGTSVHALVATSADTTVIDDDVRATAGFADRIDLGNIVVTDVPVLSRDLDDISQTLGVELGAVLGMDLLLRFSTVIDGGRREVLLLRGTVRHPDDAASVVFATFEGSFLAVPATLNGTAQGWYTLDTAGLFPVALGPLAVEALEIDPDELEPAPGAPSDAVRMTTLESIRIGGMQVDGVPAVTGLFPVDLSELAGAPISGIVGAAVTHQLRVTIDPESRRIYIE